MTILYSLPCTRQVPDNEPTRLNITETISLLISLTTTTGPNITAELVGATISITPFGLFITAPPTDTRICIVNGIQTVVQGKCPQSAGRRLAHAGGGNEGGLVGKVPANGGGLAIYGTATLTNTNVYANQAQGQVCSPSIPFLDLIFQRSAGSLHAHGCVLAGWRARNLWRGPF